MDQPGPESTKAAIHKPQRKAKGGKQLNEKLGTGAQKTMDKLGPDCTKIENEQLRDKSKCNKPPNRKRKRHENCRGKDSNEATCTDASQMKAIEEVYKRKRMANQSPRNAVDLEVLNVSDESEELPDLSD